MKKLIVIAALGTIAYGGWRWQHEPASEPAHKRALYNRIWIDHFPQGEKDTVKVFALWDPESFGVFADQNHWRVELERFRYEAHGDQVQAIFPLSGTRETMKVTATRCHEADWDFCLEISGSSHGTQRYYSRLGWERRDRNVDQFVESLRR
jgi:hypothetical protein